MSKITDLMSHYGEGDNYLQDSMFYEDALKICNRLETLRTPLTSRISVSYVRREIENIVKRQQELDKK